MHDTDLQGRVTVTAPEPVTNREFTETLAAALRRPCALKVSSALLHYGLGGMGEETLLASQQAAPERLEERGFRFSFLTLPTALWYEPGRV